MNEALRQSELNERAARRANSTFRGMLIVFGVGLFVFALVGYITTGEVAVVVLFALIYGLILLVGFWGKKHLMRDMGIR
jgi:Flp pilus assembly protein TadB